MKFGKRAIARPLAVAAVLSAVAPSLALAQQNGPVSAPSPAPLPTISGTPLPYPAYGSPAPDVQRLVQRPGIPATVSLTQAIDIAVVQSPAFASERAQYRAIFAKVGAEQGALYPSLSGSASVTRDYGALRGASGTFATASPASGALGSTGPFTTIAGQLTLSQLIFDGGRAIAAIRSAKAADVAGKDTLLRQLQTLAFNVSTAYFNVLETNATVAADQLLVREFETNENYVRAEIRTGAAARSDLAAAQFQTAQARGSLTTAQGQAIAAQSTFATTLGLDPDTAVVPARISSTAAPLKTLTYQQSIQEALTLRPDYLAAAQTVESSKENLRFAKLARMPSITASASDGYAESLPETKPKLVNSQSLGATLSIPIYDQGLTNYNVAVAASQLDQANASLVSTRLTVESDVRTALANLISARATFAQAQAELRSGQVNLQATQAQYRVGATTITALVTAEATLASAQSAYTTSLYNEHLAEQQYAYALGASDLKL
jgi:outer membrane protein